MAPGILVRRSGGSRAHRRLDGLVANFPATGFLIGVFWGFYRTPEDQCNWQAIRAALARCVTHFEKLDRWLERRSFLLGETLTLADITAGTSLYRYFEREIEGRSYYRWSAGTACFKGAPRFAITS
jgi:glutathione S-transferase